MIGKISAKKSVILRFYYDKDPDLWKKSTSFMVKIHDGRKKQPLKNAPVVFILEISR